MTPDRNPTPTDADVDRLVALLEDYYACTSVETQDDRDAFDAAQDDLTKFIAETWPLCWRRSDDQGWLPHEIAEVLLAVHGRPGYTFLDRSIPGSIDHRDHRDHTAAESEGA